MSRLNWCWLSANVSSYRNSFKIATHHTFPAGVGAGTEHLENFAVDNEARLGPCLGLSRASVLPTGPLCANALDSVDGAFGNVLEFASREFLKISSRLSS